MEEEVFFEPRSWVLTLLLCLFFGILGLHRFYTGKVFSGTAMIIITVISGASLMMGVGLIGLTVVTIWMLVDFFRILTGFYRDRYGRKLAR